MDKALGYLGLAVRAGKAAIGAEDCARELRRRKGGVVVAAADAAARTLEQTGPLCAARGVPLAESVYTKAALGAAVGRAKPVALVYIFDEGLAGAFVSAAETDREQEERV